MPEYSTDADIARVLESSKVIAVLGAHPEPSRPAHYVPDYLHRHGYRVLPVNPAYATRELWGQRVFASPGEIADAVDIVDVFRPAQALPGHLNDILSMRPSPKLVWLQLGIRNNDVARQLVEAGIDVVQDRCTLADHRRLLTR